ncbi:microtubule cross-linking factor 2-like isoform X2 [Oncorhynchus masou masou]|uniref:microtubule cross-linking factor 2-like isoform X2 n=1 Tax=Oncorhynchus masou masou TaxID=90313 RepID=UPI0031832192
MTKTKADVNSPTHFVSPKERRHRHKMESGTESADSGQAKPQQQHQFEQQHVVQPIQVNAKKKNNRAPSPARPKDVPGWSLTKIRGGIGTPTLSVKPGSIHLGSRVSRRSPVSGKETKSEKGKLTGKSTVSVASAQKSSSKSMKGGRRKVSDASNASDDQSKDSGCAAGKRSSTDSSSELSDCASEENKLSTDALSSDTESNSRGGGLDGDKPSSDCGHGPPDRGSRGDHHAKTPVDKDRISLGVETVGGSISPGDERSLTSFDSRVPASTSLAFSDLTEEFMDGMHEEFVREIEELRSENDYLKDEMEELRSEMLEMRDMYMEEDVYQLQELRQQFEQANKTCRILQYRLRKAERRSLRVAQTGQVDGELIRTLEQDVKVAKDVSIRLHNELDSVEKKRGRLEQENEELRVRLQDLEVAKQVLQAEMEKQRENSLKKRGARPNNKPEKKPSVQEDNSDLKCQLHFAKEESVLMCKKLTKMAKDSEAMREELAKYRSVYGDVDASLTVEEVNDSPHTREAEVRVHLKLVEEEANLLSRRIVELEVENRGLRAEMDDMKGQELPPGLGLGGMGGSGGGGLDNVMELQRHLQFVEEEAELLRRSLLEMEEQNKLLMNEINRYKSELPLTLDPNQDDSSSISLLEDGHGGGALISTEAPQEELLQAARLQIGELSGKVKKLQYENRVLLSNLQRCDLASYHSSSRPTLETDAEAGDSAECLPSQACREGPIGGENKPLEEKEKKTSTGVPIHLHGNVPLGLNDHEALLAMRDQARLISTAIQLLTASDSNCPSFSLYRKISSNSSGETAEPCVPEKSQQSQPSELQDLPLVEALTGRLRALHTQLQAFVKRVESLGSAPPGSEQVEVASPLPLLSEAGDSVVDTPSASHPCPPDDQAGEITAGQKQPNFRDQSEREVKGQEEEEGDSHIDNNKNQVKQETDTARQISELQALLLEARDTACRTQEERTVERQEERTVERQEERTVERQEERTVERQEERTVERQEERTVERQEERTVERQEERTVERQEERTVERRDHRGPTHSSSQTFTQLQEEHQKALTRRDFQLQEEHQKALTRRDFQLQEEHQKALTRRDFQLQEEHQKALTRRDFQLQSLSLQTRLQQKFWSQERTLMLQESQQLKQTLLLLSLKLRCFLKQWRLGRKLDTEAKDVLEVNSLKELYLLLEEESLAAHPQQGDNKITSAEEQHLCPTISKELCVLEKSYTQTSGVSSTLADLKGALQDLSGELREERQGSQELTQQFARAKASWEVERTELKSLITQLESKAGLAALAGGEKDLQGPPDLKVALKREREEHQHLLADSYAAVMDLTKQLQMGERNWNREKLELLEHFSQERGQWEQRLQCKMSLHYKTTPETKTALDVVTNGTNLSRTKSIPSMLEGLLEACPFLPGQEVNGTANEEGEKDQPSNQAPPLLTHTDPGDLTRKNWKYLTNEMALMEQGDAPFKTWDCPSSPSSFLDLESIQRSYTAPDKTGIRIYYSPPTMRRMESQLAKEKQDKPQAQQGHLSQASTPSDAVALEGQPPSSASSSSSYDQWLSSLSKQHRDLLENSSGGAGVAPFHGLEISANLSDDMKEMTNCVRQAIRSSSLERNSSKDASSQTVGVSSRSTQTVQFVSVGLQTDGLGSRGVGGFHTKSSWSSRPSSSLASARSRHISSSLDKVHSRIDRPCCSPKFGSPKLQRRISASSSKLDGGGLSSASSRDRSLWNLHQRSSTSSGSAWARSTTTRDSPVLSGLNDGLSSLFSVVEHSGSVESLWKSEPGASPARQAAGKPSGPGPDIGAQKYGPFQEFFRNVCGRPGTTMPGGGERGQREVGAMDEPKPECLSGVSLVGNDSVTKIVNKRFMRQMPREELGATANDLTARDLTLSSSMEDAACDCNSQSLTSCFARPSRSATRHSLGHCMHRSQEPLTATEERVEAGNE